MDQHYTSGEIIAYQLASKLCKENQWGDNSDKHRIAEIHYIESIKRGIDAGRITPYSPVTFTKLNLETRNLNAAAFLKQEVMDYLSSEMLSSVPAAKVVDVAIISKAEQQDNAILKWLKDNKHNPESLAVAESGKSGVKKLCRDALCADKKTFSSESVFNTAWGRLRSNKSIVDKK